MNKNHINFIENFLRGKNSNIIVELQKLKTIEEKAKFLQSQKHTCQDSKLMLWLLTPLPLKAVNSILCFSSYSSTKGNYITDSKSCITTIYNADAF